MALVEGGLQHVGRVDVQPGEQLRVGAGDPPGVRLRPSRSGSSPIAMQQLADRRLDPRQVDVRGGVGQSRLSLRRRRAGTHPAEGSRPAPGAPYCRAAVLRTPVLRAAVCGVP